MSDTPTCPLCGSDLYDGGVLESDLECTSHRCPFHHFFLSADHWAEIAAAITRIRAEERRKAIEECAAMASGTGRMVTDGLTHLGRYESGYARARANIEANILSLLDDAKEGG